MGSLLQLVYNVNVRTERLSFNSQISFRGLLFVIIIVGARRLNIDTN